MKRSWMLFVCACAVLASASFASAEYMPVELTLDVTANMKAELTASAEGGYPSWYPISGSGSGVSTGSSYVYLATAGGSVEGHADFDAGPAPTDPMDPMPEPSQSESRWMTVTAYVGASIGEDQDDQAGAFYPAYATIDVTLSCTYNGANGSGNFEILQSAPSQIVGTLLVGTSEDFPAGTPLTLSVDIAREFGLSNEAMTLEVGGQLMATGLGTTTLDIAAGDQLAVEWNFWGSQYLSLYDTVISADTATFSVAGEPAPEPASMSLLAIGAAALLRRRR